MQTQLDGENLVFVMSPREMASLETIVIGGLAVGSLAMPQTKLDQEIATHFSDSFYRLLTTEQVVEAMISQHLDHSGDDIEGLRRGFTEAATKRREILDREQAA